MSSMRLTRYLHRFHTVSICPRRTFFELLSATNVTTTESQSPSRLECVSGILYSRTRTDKGCQFRDKCCQFRGKCNQTPFHTMDYKSNLQKTKCSMCGRTEMYLCIIKYVQICANRSPPTSEWSLLLSLPSLPYIDLLHLRYCVRVDCNVEPSVRAAPIFFSNMLTHPLHELLNRHYCCAVIVEGNCPVPSFSVKLSPCPLCLSTFCVTLILIFIGLAAFSLQEICFQRLSMYAIDTLHL